MSRLRQTRGDVGTRDPLFWRRLFARDGTGGGRTRRGRRGGIRENLNYGIVNKYKKIKSRYSGYDLAGSLIDFELVSF